MSKQLTWADVAHYYAKNDPKPRVYILEEGGLKECVDLYFIQCAEDSDMPELADLADITEEDARVVLEMSNYDCEDICGMDCQQLFLECRTEEGDMMVWQSIMGNPAAIHYLISRNYNVFGVPTWKGVQS